MAATHRSTSRKNWLLPLIGVGKLLKAAVLFAAAYALRYLRHSDDLREQLVDWARAIHVDPEGAHLRRTIERVTALPPGHIHFAAIAMFVYACLFSTEGVGLILRKRWGEYVTVGITSLLLPLEVYELFEPGHRVAKIVVLVLNLAILAYLIWNLYRTRPGKETPAEPIAVVTAA